MPAGRPKKEIDYDAVERLASIMCTQQEIANHLNLHVTTLLRDEQFCYVYKKGLDEGKMSIRRQQYKSALSGNVTMQIWLGKQYLNQRDRNEITNKETVDKLDSLLEQFDDLDEEAQKDTESSSKE